MCACACVFACADTDIIDCNYLLLLPTTTNTNTTVLLYTIYIYISKGCLTVHKSQGMTLDRLELQLDDAFDYGQVYVALSRVTSLAGLWIKGKAITQQMVKAHPDVVEFHRQMKQRNY